MPLGHDRKNCGAYAPFPWVVRLAGGQEPELNYLHFHSFYATVSAYPRKTGTGIVERLLASREPLEGGKWQEHFIELILESQAEESRPCRNLTVIRQSAYFCRNMNKSGTANLSSLARRKIFLLQQKWEIAEEEIVWV